MSISIKVWSRVHNLHVCPAGSFMHNFYSGFLDYGMGDTFCDLALAGF